MKKLNELMKERSKVVEKQRSMIARVEKEGRGDFNSMEKEEYRRLEEQFHGLTSEIDLLKHRERLEEREHFLQQSIHEPNRPDLPTVDGRNSNSIETRGFRRFLRGGIRILVDEELRALQADLDPQGGYLVAPEQFSKELIKEMANLYWIRQFAKVISVPVRQAQMADPTWTAEIKTGTSDDELAFSKRNLFPHPLAKRCIVSGKLLRVSTLDIEQIVREEFAEQFGEANENAFLNGSGSNEPLGLFVASDLGISTSRDISDGNTSTTIKADGLINCLYALKAQHRRNARWIFHRDVIKQVRKLKTGDGEYLWRPGIATDAPDTILGKPFHESEYAPNTFTSGLYVGIIGDFSRYVIADALDMQIQVLDQLYAESNQIGYIARMETDGMPTIENAFVRVKLT
jgi:HK97 family phage major capsid protein